MRSRQAHETIATFVAELRKLSEFCNYGDMLEDMLQDRIVCGINNPAMQRRLLAESGLTLRKALEIAQGMEEADRSAKVMQGMEQKPVLVQRVQSVGCRRPR